MRKTSLLITSFALLVGGGLLCSASPITPNARMAAADQTYTFDFTNFSSFSEWNSSYTQREVKTSEFANVGEIEGTFTFEKANKQSSGQPIVNMPVTKGYSVTFALEEADFFIKDFSFSCEQWGSKTQTMSFEYSVDGNDYISLDGTSDNFNLKSGDISEYGAKYVKLNFSNKSNQVGIKEFTVTLGQSIQYDVTFHYGWDGEAYTNSEIVSIDNGNVVAEPEIDTSVDGYRFIGWYADENYETPFDFEAPINANTDVYAKYEATASYTIGDYFALNSTKSSMIASYQMGVANTEVTASFKNNSGVKTEFDENSNNAKAILGEDHAEYINVTYVKGDSNVSAVWGDNTGIRFYQKDTLTFTAADGVLITSIEYNWGYTEGELSINGEVAEKNGTTEINGTSFVLESTGKKQARIYSFIVHYTADLPAYKVADASLRFGANVSMEYYDETAKYGLILGNNLEDIAIKAKLNNEATAEEFATANGLVAIENTSVAFVDGNGTEVEQASATNYQFATVLTGMATHLSDKVTAAAYMEYDGKLYLMNDTTYSLKALAQKYLEDQLVTDPDGIGLLEAIIAA